MVYLYLYIGLTLLSVFAALVRMGSSIEENSMLQLISFTVAHLIWLSLIFWGLYFIHKAFI